MGTFSIWHWLIVLLIIVLVFGTKKLRNVGKDLGGAVHDFKKGLNEEDIAHDLKKDIDENTNKTNQDDTIENSKDKNV